MREFSGESETSGGSSLLLLLVMFMATQIVSYLGFGAAVLYFVTVVGGAIYVYRHPGQGIWVTFFLVAFTCLLYPITVSVLGEAGVGEFRPYNFIFMIVAGAMLFSTWTHRCIHQATQQKLSVVGKWAVVLAGLFCLATFFGDLSPFGTSPLYVLQQSSNWVSFFLFLWIGYKLIVPPAEFERALKRFGWVAFIYSAVFLIKFSYLDYQAGLVAATEFAYAQRMALMFVGCSFVLICASRLAPGGSLPTRSNWDWVSGAILGPAIVLSGSRGLLGATILTVLALVATLRRRVLMRIALPLLAVILVAVVILHSHAEVLEDYVFNRFLITPDQDASFAGRLAEMGAVTESLQRNPILGSGTLASYSYFDPLFGWRETAFVDSGIGYLLLKIGLLGTFVFSLFVIAWVRLLSCLRRVVGAYALAPTVVLVFYLSLLPFGSSFFDIKFSWLGGLVCGYSLSLARVVTGAEFEGPIFTPTGVF